MITSKMISKHILALDTSKDIHTVFRSIASDLVATLDASTLDTTLLDYITTYIARCTTFTCIQPSLQLIENIEKEVKAVL